MKAQVLVARNVRRLRVGKRLSQEALAVDAGIDRTYVSRIERGLENPTVAVLEKFAKALGAQIPDLFSSSAAVKNPVAPLPGGRKKGKDR
jgi:transcriptional regulator with XRE-family HTH domain